MRPQKWWPCLFPVDMFIWVNFEIHGWLSILVADKTFSGTRCIRFNSQMCVFCFERSLWFGFLESPKMKGIGFLWGTPIQIPNRQAPNHLLTGYNWGFSGSKTSTLFIITSLRSVGIRDFSQYKSEEEFLGSTGLGPRAEGCGVKSWRLGGFKRIWCGGTPEKSRWQYTD